MSIKLFLDSGAFGIYKKVSKGSKDGSAMSSLKSRQFDSYSYVQLKEYKEYRKQYAIFLKKNKKHFDVYANLDVIGNAELTYKNQKWFEKHGLNPCPVWHIDTDVKWLQKYIDEGYSYICIGAMVGVSSKARKEVLDRVWLNNLTDNKGMPILKVHGFGMTSFRLMKRYPWYSVDSTSWLTSPGFGSILYPKKGKEGYDWSNIKSITISNVGFKKGSNSHFRNKPSYLRKYIFKYLKSVGIPYGKSSFKKVDLDYTLKENENWYIKEEEIEIVESPGVCNTRMRRVDACLYAFTEFESHCPKWPWSIKFKNRKTLL
ncbi:MAG: hypothetical protein ACTSO3_00900 [Candidatus Heimdallarchaeaceae archaeon]